MPGQQEENNRQKEIEQKKEARRIFVNNLKRRLQLQLQQNKKIDSWFRLDVSLTSFLLFFFLPFFGFIFLIYLIRSRKRKFFLVKKLKNEIKN